MAQDDINTLAPKTGANTNSRVGAGGIILIILGVVLFLSNIVVMLRQLA